MEEAVYFKAEAGTIYMRATGHVTALVCPPLKAAVFERLDAEPPVEAMYLDLSACEYMDSTFLGLIVGAQKRYARASPSGKPGARTIVLLGVNEACKGLLRTIGVLGMVELSDSGPPFPPDLARLAGDSRASARFLLDAHEDLAGLSQDNRARFAALNAVLKSAAEAEGKKGE